MLRHERPDFEAPSVQTEISFSGGSKLQGRAKCVAFRAQEDILMVYLRLKRSSSP
jgi:hypothetical protein